MYKIFRKHYEVFLQKVFRNKDAPEKFYGEVNRFMRNSDFKDGEILHRFPKKEIRYFLRSECPTERLEDKKGIKNYEIIQSAKRLRHFMNIPEPVVCFKCSKKDTCKFKDLLPKKKETSISDLLIVTNGLYDYQNKLYGPEKKQQAKNDQNEKLDSGDEEEEEEDDVEEDEENEEEEDEEVEESEDEDVAQEDIEDRYIYKTYDSAVKVVDTLYPIMDDLRLRRGFGCKHWINTYIGERKKLSHLKGLQEDEESDDEGTEKRSYGQRRRQVNKTEENDQEERRPGRFNKRIPEGVKQRASWGTKPEDIPDYGVPHQKKGGRNQERFDVEESEDENEFGYKKNNQRFNKFKKQVEIEDESEGEEGENFFDIKKRGNQGGFQRDRRGPRQDFNKDRDFKGRGGFEKKQDFSRDRFEKRQDDRFEKRQDDRFEKRQDDRFEKKQDFSRRGSFDKKQDFSRERTPRKWGDEVERETFDNAKRSPRFNDRKGGDFKNARGDRDDQRRGRSNDRFESKGQGRDSRGGRGGQSRQGRSERGGDRLDISSFKRPAKF